MPSTPVSIVASSLSFSACAALRTSASLPSIALRSRLVTILTVLSSSAMAHLPPVAGLYQRIALARGANLGANDSALGHQFLEVRRQRARRDAMQAHRYIVVDLRQQLIHGGGAGLGERVAHFLFAHQAMRDEAAYLVVR